MKGNDLFMAVSINLEAIMEQVTIIVSPDGATQVSVQCVKGKACQDVSVQIERALGGKVSDMPTAEMREVSHVQHRR